MNKSYRTIWNEALGAWVAASEIARSRVKRGSVLIAQGGAIIVLSHLGMLGALTPIGAVYAQTLPEAPCTAGVGGSMYLAQADCVNYVNNSRIYQQRFDRCQFAVDFSVDRHQ